MLELKLMLMLLVLIEVVLAELTLVFLLLMDTEYLICVNGLLVLSQVVQPGKVL